MDHSYIRKTATIILKNARNYSKQKISKNKRNTQAKIKNEGNSLAIATTLIFY